MIDMKLNKYIKRLILAGVIALCILSLGAYAIGDLSGYEAKDLFKKSISGINMLSNTIILASATILALLLTVLGLGTDLNDELCDAHYKHIKAVAKLDVIVLISAIVSFIIFNLPITEGENVPKQWYTTIYYTTIGITSLLGAALMVVVMMLYKTITNLIASIGFGKDSIFATDEDEEEQRHKKTGS